MQERERGRRSRAGEDRMVRMARARASVFRVAEFGFRSCRPKKRHQFAHSPRGKVQGVRRHGLARNGKPHIVARRRVGAVSSEERLTPSSLCGSSAEKIRRYVSRRSPFERAGDSLLARSRKGSRWKCGARTRTEGRHSGPLRMRPFHEEVCDRTRSSGEEGREKRFVFFRDLLLPRKPT